MDIVYLHNWTTIHRDLTYSVLCSMINAVPEYDQNSILHCKQPMSLSKNAVNREKLEQMPQPQANFFDDIREITFLDTGARYEVITETISKNKHTDPKSIV